MPVLVNAQEVLEVKEKKAEKVYYLHNGKFIPKEKVDKYEKPYHKDNLNRNMFGDILLSPDDLEDTLGYKDLWGTGVRFGFEGEDRMVMWFEAPADMRIISAGFMCTDNDDTSAASVKLVEFAWTMDEINNAVPRPTYLGYYEATGNGFNDATAYLDDPDRTGDWVDSTGLGKTSPFGNDIWSDGGVGFPFTPLPAPGPYDTGYIWIPFDVLFEPEVKRFDIIGVSTKNLRPIQGDEVFIRWYATQESGLPGTFKFYSNGRLTAIDFGWWAREFIWDYLLAVVLTGDVPPDINSFTELTGTISTLPRTVDANITDENPAGGNAGVAIARILYSIDGGANWLTVVMTGTEPDYTGEIPGQPGGTEVTYKIEATDVGSNTSTSLPEVYFVSEVVNGTNLVILNGFDYTDTNPFPEGYYFGEDVMTGLTTFPHDVWQYGPVEADLLSNYTNVFEIWNADQGDYNEDMIELWLAGAGNRNYFLAGQEYLGQKNSYVDSFYVAGDFEYDILGIDSSYNDITYYFLAPPTGNTLGDSLGTLVTPVAGTLFGDPLIALFNSLDPPADSMLHNPFTILDPGDGSELNWQDAFHVVPGVGVIVDMMVETKGIGEFRPNPEVETWPTLAHRELTAGNKIVFAAFDPLSLNTEDDSTAADFHWMGFNNASPTYQALLWFGVAVGVEKEDNVIPKTFSLSQNYPNPFNPSTSIKFSIPEASNVVLKVYDILGSEVAVLVNEKVQAGNYTVNFDASQFASGMYIYSIKAGEFNVSKKMMLLK
jgi:hypothetical protein